MNASSGTASASPVAESDSSVSSWSTPRGLGSGSAQAASAKGINRAADLFMRFLPGDRRRARSHMGATSERERKRFMETAILAGGCFWCTEAVFRDVVGVGEVESGYIGGTLANPT